jgi:hypothetical protein
VQAVKFHVLLGTGSICLTTRKVCHCFYLQFGLYIS